jgi:hypothetical protein
VRAEPVEPNEARVREALPTHLYVTNWYLLASRQLYFDAVERPAQFRRASITEPTRASALLFGAALV